MIQYICSAKRSADLDFAEAYDDLEKTITDSFRIKDYLAKDQFYMSVEMIVIDIMACADKEEDLLEGLNTLRIDFRKKPIFYFSVRDKYLKDLKTAFVNQGLSVLYPNNIKDELIKAFETRTNKAILKEARMASEAVLSTEQDDVERAENGERMAFIRTMLKVLYGDAMP